MNKKSLIYGLLGSILIIIWIEQLIAVITNIHWALNSWASFIILLIPGIFFIERAYKQRKNEN